MPHHVKPPTLSFSERNLRWSKVKKLMQEHDIEAMLVAGFRSREMYESYVSDDYNEGCVLFPLDGEPTVLTWAQLRVMRARWSQSQGHELWIQDYRVATSGLAAAEWFKERKLTQARIGVVGLNSQAPTEVYGCIPANFWTQLTQSLSNVEFIDLSEEFSHLMLVKSQEEMAQIKYAAKAAEYACSVILEIARPGVGEEVIFAEATRAMLSFGIGIRYPALVMNSGPATLSWGPPRWSTRAERPRILKEGDLLQTELMPMCGNQEVQVQMTVALGAISEINQKCEKVALESYAQGLNILRPGITFNELVLAMEEPLKASGCWAYTPLVHSISPHFLVGRSLVNTENLDLNISQLGKPSAPHRAAIVQEGMVFAFEPNACLNQNRVNIGGTVAVTSTGCVALNEIPCKVNHVSI
jgi:Xaa-Pro aminopeptidase